MNASPLSKADVIARHKSERKRHRRARRRLAYRKRLDWLSLGSAASILRIFGMEAGY
jgi:hypothetical protein